MSSSLTFDSFYNGVKEYCKEIPRNTLSEAAKAFVIGFGVVTILSGNPVLGVLDGTFAFVATTIHGAVSPLFKRCIGSRNCLTWTEEMLRTSVALLGTGLLSSLAGRGGVLRLLTKAIVVDGISVALIRQYRRADKAHCVFI